MPGVLLDRARREHVGRQLRLCQHGIRYRREKPAGAADRRVEPAFLVGLILLFGQVRPEIVTGQAGDAKNTLGQVALSIGEIIRQTDDAAADINLLPGERVVEAIRVVEENDRVVAPPPLRRLPVEHADGLDKGQRAGVGFGFRGVWWVAQLQRLRKPDGGNDVTGGQLSAVVEHEPRCPARLLDDPRHATLHAALAASRPELVQ